MNVNNKILQLWFDKIGLSAEFFGTYENASQCELQNLDRLADTLHQIRLRGDKIVLLSDFDTDGIMSGIIGFTGLKELGLNVNLYEPKPENGYGIRTTDIEAIVALHPDVKVILTADVGITANAAIEHAQKLGVAVLVTDHHLSQEPCRAEIAVNPNQLGETYDQPSICGAFVLYKVLERYAHRYSDMNTKLNIACLRMFAGIATVADVMSLTGENRQLVRDSITLMRSFYKGEFPGYAHGQSAFSGLIMLLKHLQDNKKISSENDINEEFLGFYLIPLLNSAKRMSGDMRGVYDIFFCREANNLHHELRVETAIKYLVTLNEDRRRVTAAWLEYLKANSDKFRCGVYVSDAPAGLSGLLAMQLMQLSGMPTLVLKYDPENDSYRGSGRSPGWFHFPNETVKAGLELRAAGHAGAFGVEFPSTKALYAYFDFYNSVIAAAAGSGYEEPKIIITDDVTIAGADLVFDAYLIRDFLNEYEKFRPWGEGFRSPKFKMYIRSGFKAKVFGNNQQHGKFITDDGLEVLLFNKSEMLKSLGCENGYIAGLICVEGSFKLNVYNGMESLNFFADIAYRTDEAERLDRCCA